MSDKTTLFLSLLVIVAMGIILIMNIAPMFSSPGNERYIAYNDISGIAVIHENAEYILNFDQQNSFIQLFNRALPVSKREKVEPLRFFTFSKIIVYPFKKPAAAIIPIAIEKDNLLFSVPEWNANLLLDVSDGELKNLLLSTYEENRTNRP